MGQTHPSMPNQRAQWAAMMLAHEGTYGLVTTLSRAYQVSRPTLYAWRDHARRALVAAFSPAAQPEALPVTERHILTLWIQHASVRGIQAATRELLQQGISLATITAVLHAAGERAIAWMRTHVPPTTRALALDELYANNRCGAYLNVVDVHSGAVWASEGPLPVDTESWVLVLWELEARGLVWDRVVLDGGLALQSACHHATPTVLVQGDSWHELHGCAQVQQRLERIVRTLEARTPVVARQAARLAAGQRPKGRNPTTDVDAHAQEVALARQMATNTRFLTEELRRLLAPVVVGRDGLLTAGQRQDDLNTVLSLLDEVGQAAPAAQQPHVRRLHTHLTARLPALLTFVPHLDQVQHDLHGILPPAQQALVGWAWLRRHTLRWRRADILAALPDGWRAAARILLAAWDDAVWVSSAVERWHSIMRPHLAVRRTMSTGMLALLAVWQNHRVFPRGVHKGMNPLHLSGMTDAPTDWLVALGYMPDAEVTPHAAPMAQAA